MSGLPDDSSEDSGSENSFEIGGPSTGGPGQNPESSRDMLLNISAFIKAVALSSETEDQSAVDLEKGYSISLNLELGISISIRC